MFKVIPVRRNVDKCPKYHQESYALITVNQSDRGYVDSRANFYGPEYWPLLIIEHLRRGFYFPSIKLNMILYPDHQYRLRNIDRD